MNAAIPAVAEKLATSKPAAVEKPEQVVPGSATATKLAAAPPPPTQAVAWGEAIRDGLGWWWQEGWGCWTRDGIATRPRGSSTGVDCRAHCDPGTANTLSLLQR